jgi:D-proline reductase (dithiol) PrdB
MSGFDLQDYAGETGVDFARLERDWVRTRTYAPFAWLPFDAFSPMNPVTRSIAQARIALVTTVGAHLAADRPFDTESKAGDTSYRTFPALTPLSDLVLSHSGYDTSRASKDLNVVLPLDRFREVERDGGFAGFTPTVYSTMGYIGEPGRFYETTCQEIARRLVEDKPDLVFLAPT